MRALVIDDSSTINSYHTSLLIHFGFEADSAVNGMQGLEMALKKEYDLILADINMPIMDGFEFVKKVRKYEYYKKIPIVFITTLNSKADRQKALLAGGNLYLVKPIDLKVLEEILTSLVKDKKWKMLL